MRKVVSNTTPLIALSKISKIEIERPKMFHSIGIKQELEEVFSLPVDIVRIRKKMNEFLRNRIEREAIFV